MRLTDLDLYKLRVGEYRILMSIQKDKLIIMVVEIGHRRNVYR